MKQLALVACMVALASSDAYAETISRIEKNRVTVSDAQGMKEGMSVEFLDSDLKVQAKGVVEKVSSQGNTAVIRVTSGQAKENYVIEKKAGSEPKASEPVASAKHGDLTEEEREILDRGEIDQTAYIVGGILGTWPLGLGIGHAIQGRYPKPGLIFTLGELAAAGLIVVGIAERCTYSYSSLGSLTCDGDEGLYTVGVIALVGLRLWEIIDLWAVPPSHNRRVRELKARTGQASLEPTLIPVRSGNVALGLQYRF
jgi:hypothetical protein